MVFLAAQLAVAASPGGLPVSSGGSELTAHTPVVTSLRVDSPLKHGKRRSLPRVPSSSTDQESSCSSTTSSHGHLLAAMWLVQFSEPSTCASLVKHELSTLRSAFVIQKHHV